MASGAIQALVNILKLNHDEDAKRKAAAALGNLATDCDNEPVNIY